MKALSIRQPWAWLIVNGYKDVENRTWDCPATFHPPERIYVHAGLKQDYGAYDGDAAYRYLQRWIQELIEWDAVFEWDAGRPALGAIVGEITVSTWTDGWAAGSPWFRGPYGLIISDPIAYAKPIPYKGRLGLFDVILPASQRCQSEQQEG